MAAWLGAVPEAGGAGNILSRRRGGSGDLVPGSPIHVQAWWHLKLLRFSGNKT